MVNKDFQKLKGDWMKGNPSEKTDIELLLRENLLKRNAGNQNYTFSYTMPNKKVDLMECSVSELFAVDGDMAPLGK